MGGVGFDGGHDEDRGVDPGGRVIDVPLHQHQVSLDFLKLELGVEVTVFKGWDVWLRVPYEAKRQRTTIKFVEPLNLEQARAIVKNGFIHHRSDSYVGPGDLQLLGAHRIASVLTEGDMLTIAAGFTIPTGQTERDPFEAGHEGRKHLHIQFGTGTLDPLLELSYYLPLPVDGLALNFAGVGRFPFYENKKTYQAPVELTGSGGVLYRFNDWLGAFLETSVFFQSFGHWDGHRDENSGLISWNAGFSLMFTVAPGVTITGGVRFPIAQKLLLNDGEAFKRGPTFLLDVSFLLP